MTNKLILAMVADIKQVLATFERCHKEDRLFDAAGQAERVKDLAKTLEAVCWHHHRARCDLAGFDPYDGSQP